MTDDHRMPRPAPIRDASRFATIGIVLARNGLGHWGHGLGLPGTEGSATTIDSRRHPRALRETLEELGPVYVKFGQLLATRRERFSQEWIDEFEKLQSRATPFPGEEAKQVVERELGAPIDELYKSFDMEPMAAASMAQVHCAVMHDDTQVVVKVQRPGIEATVESDLSILRYLAQAADRYSKNVKQYNIPQLVDEFSQMLREELDFEREAQNALRFAETNSDEQAVYVPAVYNSHSSKRVLTMAHSTGREISSTVPADKAERTQLAHGVVRLFLVQVLEHGVFHADPHAGNVFLLDDGRLCFHDFGALGVLEVADQENFRQLFLAVIARDPEWLADVYIAMGGACGTVDRSAFSGDLERALSVYYASGKGISSLSAVLSEFVRLGHRHRIQLVRQSALVIRAFATVEALAHKLNPEFRTVSAFQQYSTRLIKALLKPDLSYAGVARTYRSMKSVQDFVTDLPVVARRVIEQVGRGGLPISIRHEIHDSLEREIGRAANRLAFALITASVVIGSSIVLSLHVGPHVEEWPLVGIVGFALAAALGLTWTWITARSGKQTG